MNEFLGILASPGETFEKIMDRPRWLLPTLFSVVIFFVIVWLGSCWHNLSQAFTWERLLGPALISPLIVGIVLLGSTTVVYLINRLLRGEKKYSASFKTLLSVNVHCGIIFLLGEVVNFLLVRANVLGDRSFPLPNRFPTGLDVILLGVDDPSLYLTIILHSTSIFVAWYLLVLSQGIRAVTGSGRARSSIIIMTLWCAAVMTALGIAYAAGGTTTIRVAI